MSASRENERRTVRSADPSLTPETNERLTDELRDAIGSDTVEVDPRKPDVAHASHGGHSPLRAMVLDNRVVFGSGAAAVIVVGAIVALITGSWWVLAAAVVLDIVGVLATAGVILQMTTEVEHVSPSLAARMEEEGVPDPDRAFTDLVDEYSGPAEGARVRDVLRPGANDRGARPEDDPAASQAEQRTAWTPASGPSEPALGESRERPRAPRSKE